MVGSSLLKKQSLSYRIETDFIFEILLTYNNKLKNTTAQFTPSEARKAQNEFDVRINLLLHKRHTRLYPSLEVSDKVKIIRKKKINEKERHSKWSDNIYEVEKISKSLGQNYIKLKGLDRMCLRSELLKV